MSAQPVSQGEGFYDWLLGRSSFPARWHCGSGWSEDPWLGWLHVLAGGAITLAYLVIPLALLYWLQRTQPRSKRVVTTVRLFAVFVLACGLGHGLEVLIFWVPVYRISGPWLGVTAIVSLWTSGYLIAGSRDFLRLQRAHEDDQRLFDVAWHADGIGLCAIHPETYAFELANRAVQLFFERSEEELQALTFVDITHPDDLAADLELVEEVKRGERTHYTIDKRYLTKHSGWKWGRLTVAAIRNEDGSVQRFLSQIQDVDAEHRVLEEQRSRLAELEKVRLAPDVPSALDAALDAWRGSQA